MKTFTGDCSRNGALSKELVTDDTALERIRRILREKGCSDAEINAALDQDTLDLFAIERIFLPGQRRFTLAQVALDAGVSIDLVRKVWRALGFVDVADDEVAFTDMDRVALDLLASIVGLEFATVEQVLHGARVIGSSMARIAEATLGEDLDRLAHETSTLDDLAEFIATSEAGLSAQAQLMEFAWRHHIQEATRRRLVHRDEGEGSHMRPVLTVGFADIVEFTALSLELSAAELTDVVQRFEEVSIDVVTDEGGRAIKMMGDEVLFAVDSTRSALRIGLRLADLYRYDEIVSNLRVGIARGHVLPTDGDLFGPTVNLASRLVALGRPGKVLVASDVAEALDRNDGQEFAFGPIVRRNLKGVGEVVTRECRWSDDS